MSNTQSRDKTEHVVTLHMLQMQVFMPFMLNNRSFQKEDYLHSGTKIYAKSLKSQSKHANVKSVSSSQVQYLLKLNQKHFNL